MMLILYFSVCIQYVDKSYISVCRFSTLVCKGLFILWKSYTDLCQLQIIWYARFNAFVLEVALSQAIYLRVA